MRPSLNVALCLSLLVTLCGCKSVYYGAMETVGIEKRNIMSDRVVGLRKTAETARDVFKSALDRYLDVVNVPGGELEKKYRKLDRALQRSEKQAKAVYDRIDSVETVSKDLFKEWKKELKQYSDRDMRAASERKLKAAKQDYEGMMASMRRAASKMDPVLKVLKDQVLFLKHNLNSQAISGLQNEAKRVQTQVSDLVADMERSIAEADAFIQRMGLMDR